MATLSQVFFFSLLGGIVSLLGGIILLRRRSVADRLARYATPFAAGALLAAVFLDLLPEGIEASSGDIVFLWALAGIVGFFLLERFLTWFHHHHEHDHSTQQAARSLVIIGDTIHNLLDGIVIAAAFLVSVPVGIMTTLAVAAHEIPQEIGDFGLLLAKGMRRRHVLLVNLLSAIATVIAAVVTFQIGSSEALPVGPLLGLSAGFLLYIALSDAIPTIHEQIPKKRLLDIRPFLLLLGVAVVAIGIEITHQFIEHG